MRTKFDLIKYASTLMDNWGKMCELSNNDYDIRYFNARAIIDNNFIYNLNDINDEDFDVEKIINKLKNNIKDCLKFQEEYKEKYDTYGQKTQGYIDEYNFLIRICKQEYCG